MLILPQLYIHASLSAHSHYIHALLLSNHSAPLYSFAFYIFSLSLSLSFSLSITRPLSIHSLSIFSLHSLLSVFTLSLSLITRPLSAHPHTPHSPFSLTLLSLHTPSPHSHHALSPNSLTLLSKPTHLSLSHFTLTLLSKPTHTSLSHPTLILFSFTPLSPFFLTSFSQHTPSPPLSARSLIKLPHPSL